MPGDQRNSGGGHAAQLSISDSTPCTPGPGTASSSCSIASLWKHRKRRECG